MVKIFFYFVLFTLSCLQARAQKNDFFISGGLNVPVGDFSKTHWLAASAEVFSLHYHCDSVKEKKISFTYKAGLAYYFAGQKEIVNGFTNIYPAYWYGYGFGGIVYKPVKRLNITLAVGPAISRYLETTRFNMGAELNAYYFIHCNLSVGPTLHLVKEGGADGLWALGAKLNFRL
jgi:hypothetical protein